MPPTDKPSTPGEQGEGDPGRPYALLETLLLVGLAAAAVLGIFGVAGPGILSIGTAFAVTGGAVLVLATATALLLVVLRRTVRQLRRHEARINEHQDERAKLFAQVQRMRDARQDEEHRRTLAVVAERERHLAARVDGAIRAEEQKFQEMLDRQEAQFAGMMRRYEGRLEDLAARTALATQVLQGPSLTFTPDEAPSPFGRALPVVDIVGIGEGYRSKLRKLGIVDTRDLWRADATALADRLGVPRRTVRAWQEQAELLAIEALRPTHADVLVAAGVGSIEALARADPVELLARVGKAESARETRMPGGPVGPGLVDGWIHAARVHRPT